MEQQNNFSENVNPTVKTKVYSTVDGVTTVYPSKIFGIIALICSIVFLVLAIVYFTGRIFEIIFTLLYLSGGASLFTFSFVQRYYLDNEKIIHRTMFGVKKQLYWKDIKTVCTNPLLPTDIKLYGAGKIIKIYPSSYFGSGSELILKRIRKYCADAEWKSLARIFS